jgi:hypothetical protein
VFWAVTRGNSWGEQGVVLLSIGLRLLSIAIALASVQRWGERLPSWIVLAGLWGAAAVQLLYPVAETVVKTLILLGIMAPMNEGISNMSAEGWFNFAAMWALWGVPGTLILLAALAYRKRRPARGWRVLLGVVGGAVLLSGLGLLIG